MFIIHFNVPASRVRADGALERMEFRYALVCACLRIFHGSALYHKVYFCQHFFPQVINNFKFELARVAYTKKWWVGRGGAYPPLRVCVRVARVCVARVLLAYVNTRIVS